MKLYFQARPGDVNAVLVKQVLETRGVEVVIDPQTAFPGFETRTISLSNDEAPLQKIRLPGVAQRDLSDFDVVMCLSAPSVTPAPAMSEQDIPYIERDARRFLEASDYFLGDDIFWVNSWPAHQLALLKPLQLKQAQKLGFNIPDTIISNDADDILAFCRAHNGNIIMKFLEGVSWGDGDGTSYTVPTTPISEFEILSNREELSFCPAIFQGYVDKAYEVRVTMMGATAIAAKLDSQRARETSVDWRGYGRKGVELAIEPMTLPADIYEKCQAFMKEMGLVYGCLDFIVSPDGKYHFLEVNSAGKFLWKELEGEGFPMLHVFCEFLRSRDPDFIWDGKAQYLARALMESPAHQALMAHTYDGQPNWVGTGYIREA